MSSHLCRRCVVEKHSKQDNSEARDEGDSWLEVEEESRDDRCDEHAPGLGENVQNVVEVLENGCSTQPIHRDDQHNETHEGGEVVENVPFRCDDVAASPRNEDDHVEDNSKKTEL